MTKTTSLLLSALLGAAAVSAQAGELYSPVQYQDPPSSLTRAQAKQAVLEARKAGELNHNDIDLPDEQAVAFGKSRGQVKSETLADLSAGGRVHNDVDLPNVARGSSVLTRQEVRAEAIASRQLVRKAPGSNTIEY